MPQQRSASEMRQIRAREQAEGHAHGAGVDVLAVADELRDHILPLGGRTDGAGLAVVDAGHSVIQVRQMAGPGGEDRRGILIAAVGMRDGDRAELRGLRGKVHCARQLRRHIHDAHQPLAGLVERAERFEVRQAEVRAVLRALFLLGEERPLHLDAHQAGAARGCAARL